MMDTVSILYILFGGITFIALLGTVDLFLPKPVTLARQKLEANPVRSFVVGIINILFWFVILAFWFVWTQYKGGPEVMTFVIGSALAILLLARPMIHLPPVVERQMSNIEIVLDISESMSSPCGPQPAAGPKYRRFDA